jgi:CcmD family protein
MTWLVAAYSAFFVLFFAYTIRMSLKQKDLDRRIDELRIRLAETDDSDTRPEQD